MAQWENCFWNTSFINSESICVILVKLSITVGRLVGVAQSVNRVFIKLAVDQSIFIPFGLFFLGAVLQL